MLKFLMFCIIKFWTFMYFLNIFLYLSRFFDTNPSGRIMNRFSADVAGIDQVYLHTLYKAYTFKTIPEWNTFEIHLDWESLYPQTTLKVCNLMSIIKKNHNKIFLVRYCLEIHVSVST